MVFFSKYEIGNRNSLSLPLLWLLVGREFATMIISHIFSFFSLLNYEYSLDMYCRKVYNEKKKKNTFQMTNNYYKRLVKSKIYKKIQDDQQKITELFSSDVF